MRIPEDIIARNTMKMLNAFPADLKGDVESVVEFLMDKKFDIHPTVEQEVVVNDELLIIPGRVYFDEPAKKSENSLSYNQQIILNCIYLRHHNGFVRQEALEKLKNNNEYFVVPFVFQLIGEYVIEILEVINEQLNQSWFRNFAQFVEENPKYWKLTESRMISYWDEYYRRPRFPKLKEYVGYEIISKIKIIHRKLYEPK